MPWHVTESDQCPAARPWAVVKDSDGAIEGCHPSKAAAEKQMAALYAAERSEEENMNMANATDWTARAEWTTAYINDLPDSAFLYIEPGGKKDEQGKTTPRSLRHFPYKDANGKIDLPHLRNALARIPQSNLSADLKQRLMAKARTILENQQGRDAPPRDNLFRGMADLEVRSEDGGLPTLVGHMAVFDEWAEIESMYEGHFLERINPGAFKKTFAENRSQMRVLFDHGQDPFVGKKPLGPIAELREEDTGAWYEVPMLDTEYNRDLVPGLRAGLYGSSFRFRVTREQYDNKPARSDWNPDGIPERTIKEVHLREFGPVTFPAYKGATATVRSLTDEFILRQFGVSTELVNAVTAPDRPGAGPEPPREVTPPSKPREPQFESREEWLTWLKTL